MDRPKYNKNKFNLLVESGVAQVGEGAGNPFIDGGNTNELLIKEKLHLQCGNSNCAKVYLVKN